LSDNFEETGQQGAGAFDLVGLHADRQYRMRNGSEQMGPERIHIGLPAHRGVEARCFGQLSFENHPVNGRKEQ
jgi:hypothetical protein